jgi:nucleotide-binding universal stress UspA family protein
MIPGLNPWERITAVGSPVAAGPAHTKIIDVAKERNASMIVMTTHGRTGLFHALIGRRVVRSVPPLVFSIKPKGV